MHGESAISHFLPTHITDTLKATLAHVLADAHHILSCGRIEQPRLFAAIGYDDVLRFARSVAGHSDAGRERTDDPQRISLMPNVEVEIANQVLRRLALWPAEYNDAAAAWELALNALLLERHTGHATPRGPNMFHPGIS